ncbi:MAG: TlpA family protein disulfide reductase [Candidatus Azobacteroides sp.]|nr:TlpA family protein disulfide reductase [Candidatus Azobacteroides sp.]
MRFLKYVFVGVLLLFFISFTGEQTARSSEGLFEGNKAPEISVDDLSGKLNLKDFEGRYVLVNFWAAYDARSRENNVSLWNEVKKINKKEVAMVSVSFDKFESVFEETVKIDGIDQTTQFYEAKGENSELFKKYQLQKGFTSYLLDKSGKILAKGVHAENLRTLLRN